MIVKMDTPMQFLYLANKQLFYRIFININLAHSTHDLQLTMLHVEKGVVI